MFVLPRGRAVEIRHKSIAADGGWDVYDDDGAEYRPTSSFRIKIARDGTGKLFAAGQFQIAPSTSIAPLNRFRSARLQ